ncbi:MAG: T9SS type A sorting domain-containing protein [Patescibacteria group bacterium]|nr:T9SS type A sorting domain-containing protein [Patescibacteria group bacterium]
MKKLMITLLLAFGLMSLSFTVFSQEFYLDKIHETGISVFTNIFVSGEEILAFTTGEGLYYNGSQWGGVQIPNSNQWGQMHAFTKTGGEIFASFSTAYKSYLWDDNDKAWDFYSSPIQSPSATFVYSENKIYICTYDNSALYLWDGSSNFTELAINNEVGFQHCFVINENNVLILGSMGGEGNYMAINKLFRYNGSSIQEIASFDLDKGWAKEIHSVDLETFFIPTDEGYLYRWNDTDSQLDKIYTLDGCGGMNIVVKDNDNVFIYSNLGIKHLKVSTGVATDLMDSYPGYGEYPVTSVMDGFFEKETGRLFLSCYGGIMYEIKPDSTNSVDGINDISSEVKLYPNPATDNIYLQLPNSPINSAKGAVYNVIGAQVMDFNFNSNTENLDISSLPTGMYMLKIQTSDGRGVKKFIKK